MGSTVSVHPSSMKTVRGKCIATPIKSSGCELVLQNEGARHAFVEFLKGGSWLPALTLTYLTRQKRPTMSFSCKRIEKETQLTDITEGNLLDCMVLQANEFQILFPLFLSSPQYGKWVYDTVFEERIIPVEFHTQVKDPVYKVRPYYLIRNSRQALRTVDREEIPYLHAHGGWIKDLISEVDALPWAVVLSAARPGRQNFPLVYVNCTYLEQTGYHHEDVIGRPYLSFVCDKYTSPTIDMYQLEEALLSAQPVKVFLTTTRKDNTHFTNLVISKPLFDDCGQYVYAMSVQCAVADAASAQKLCQDVQNLLISLPNILK